MTFPNRPPLIDLCRQIGRLWAAESSLGGAGGWGFVEPDASTPGNIYCPQLPELKFREAMAAGINATEPGFQEPELGVLEFIVEVTSAAPTQDLAIAIASDFLDVYFPNGWQRVTKATAGVGARPAGLFGFAEPATGINATVWRIVAMEIQGGPVAIPGGRSDGRTEEGQYLGRATIRVTAHPQQITGA